MAAWLTVLTSVPWSEVIKNAPKVVDGSKKFWNMVAKKTHLKEISVSEPSTVPESSTIDSLEASVSDLQAQMLASSELIKELAEQNTQLIKRIETNRVRLLWLSMITSVIAIITFVLSLILMFP
jgi:Sec7-like guanine-nucleotide exchange factor